MTPRLGCSRGSRGLARPPAPGVYIIGAYDLVRAKAAYGVDWLKQYRVVDTIGYSVYVFQVP